MVRAAHVQRGSTRPGSVQPNPKRVDDMGQVHADPLGEYLAFRSRTTGIGQGGGGGRGKEGRGISHRGRGAEWVRTGEALCIGDRLAQLPSCGHTGSASPLAAQEKGLVLSPGVSFFPRLPK